jgi:hypothetical protein
MYTINDLEMKVDAGAIADRIHAGWLGRCVGNGLGKPFESALWTPGLIRDYLKSAGAWPLVDYVPLLEPMPERFVLRQDCYHTTTRGNIDGVTRDDDLDYTLLNLLLLERHGRAFSTEQVGALWLELLPFGNATGAGWDEALAWIHGLDYYYVHTINTAAIIAAALLWSDGDFTTAIGLAVSSAYDTDSNGATVGAIAGVLAGTSGMPRHWTEPLHDRLTSALSGHATESIADLAARTHRLL